MSKRHDDPNHPVTPSPPHPVTSSLAPRPSPLVPRPNNEVIRASAGTGKTYQLSNRFLGLVAAGVPLDTILATTFTRKAAGEILGRVLSRLAEAAADPKKLAELGREHPDAAGSAAVSGALGRHGPPPAPDPRQHARQLLS